MAQGTHGTLASSQPEKLEQRWVLGRPLTHLFIHPFIYSTSICLKPSSSSHSVGLDIQQRLESAHRCHSVPGRGEADGGDDIQGVSGAESTERRERWEQRRWKRCDVAGVLIPSSASWHTVCSGRRLPSGVAWQHQTQLRHTLLRPAPAWTCHHWGLPVSQVHRVRGGLPGAT